MPRDTCAKPTCTDGAVDVYAAKGTNREIAVCERDGDWAKENLLQDFPGHTITRETTYDRVVRDRTGESLDLDEI